MANARLEPPKGEESKPRAALVLVHGIGEQGPYEVLDTFVRGLVRGYLHEGSAPKLEPRLHEVQTGESAGTTRFSLRVTHPELPYDLDVFEVYWAGLVQGRIGVRQVFEWMLATVVTPLRYWQQQASSALRQRGRTHVLFVILREVAQALLLLGVAAGLVYIAATAALNYRTVYRELDSLAQQVQAVTAQPVWFVLLLLLSIIALLLTFSIVSSLLSAWRIRRRHRALGVDWAGLEATTLRTWVVPSVLMVALLAGVTSYLYRRLEPTLTPLLSHLFTLLTRGEVLGALGVITLALVGGGLLVRYVGDVVLYVTADQKSAFYRTRQEIRRTTGDLLKDLLTHQKEGKDSYDALFLAGHSLGSVIAFDAINDLERDPTASQVLNDKLRGLLTFGSPLDKVYYFFRQRVRAEAAVRAQVLSYLHATRRKRSGLEYGPYTFEPYEVPRSTFYWMNLYSTLDFVSGYLDFYEVDEQHDLGYRLPVVAHSSYWQDDDFYRLVVKWLKEGEAVDNRAVEPESV